MSKKKTVYTYHAFVPGLNVDHATRLLLLWKRNWSKAGYTPIVLNEYIARQHPAFVLLEKRVAELPTINTGAYEAACYYRWAAMAVAGGGLMTDADVMIYGEVPTKGLPDKIVSFQKHIPCCVHGSRKAYDQVVTDILEYKVTEKDIEEESGRPHVSDMYMFYRDGIRFTSLDVVKNHGDPGWDKAPLVHYANATMRGHQPRHEHITKLRPF